jgi:uroporphyrinogen-III synthase
VTQPLAGLVVVVTRPARQSARFSAMLAEHGAAPVAFPSVAIEPVPLGADVRAALGAQPIDWVIYTSANAVEQALAQTGRLPRAATAAIGRATARAVEAAGIHVDAIPAAGADSEGLLALPGFAAPAGRRIVLFKGAGGRDALRAELVRRGATVVVAEVYRRVPVVPAAGSLEKLASACAMDSAVVAVTSVEVLESLLQLAPESRAPRLVEATLLVPGERVAAAARRHGWRGPIVVARSAEDEAMLDALIEHRAAGGAPAPA